MSIKDLRNRTQAGFMDCKKALEESAGDMDLAMKILKEKGLSKALKRSDMETNEGAIVILENDEQAGMLFLSSETDFVSKSDAFCDFANKELSNFLSSEENEMNDTVIHNEKFDARIAALVSVIGENITLKDFFKTSKKDKHVFLYSHNKLNDKYDNIAKIGVLISFDKQYENDFAKELGMHIAAFKPENLEELLNQNYVMDSSLKVKQVLEGAKLSLIEFKIFYV